MQLPLKNVVVVFDLDGTLVDSMGEFGVIASQVMHQLYGCAADWALEQYRLTSGIPYPFQLEKIFPSHSLNAQAASLFDQRKSEYYLKAPFFNDVKGNLENLKKNGARLAVSSNNDHPTIEQKMKDSSLTGLFDLVLGFKPGFLKGRAHLDFIRKKLGDNCRLVFVGDSIHDGLMARENKVDFIARLGTFSAGDFEAEGFKYYVNNFDSLSEKIITSKEN